MSQTILAVISTIIAGVMGTYLGAAINIEGYLGIILSVATMGGFIIATIESNRMK